MVVVIFSHGGDDEITPGYSLALRGHDGSGPHGNGQVTLSQTSSIKAQLVLNQSLCYS